jgi:hypothetical protein
MHQRRAFAHHPQRIAGHEVRLVEHADDDVAGLAYSEPLRYGSERPRLKPERFR